MNDVTLAMVREQIRQDEGLRFEPYRCPAGKLTIGIGRNLEDRGISEDEAMMLFNNDINKVLADLAKYLPWHNKLPDAAQGVLLNMVFNLGIGGLLKFTKTLKAFEREDWETAAAEMLDSLWARQVPDRARRLARIVKWLGRHAKEIKGIEQQIAGLESKKRALLEK